MTKKPFHVLLTEDQRSKLEAHRAAFGLRSEGAAIQHLIDNYAVGVKAARITYSGPPSATTHGISREEFDAAAESARKTGVGAVIGPITPAPGSRLKKGK